MATTGTPKVNRPVNVKEKEADVNRKLQLYGILNAFQNGKVPSNDQIDVALSSFLESKALSSPSSKLSGEGRALVGDFKNVVKQAKDLLLSKNDGNLLQDFIWQTQQFDPKTVATPGAPVDKNTAQQHGNQALEGLRTLGTLIITNGQFRKLLKDATVLFRDMAGDAATNAAARVKPSHEELDQLDTPAADNTWHEAPDFKKSKEEVKNKLGSYYKGDPKEDAKAAASQGTNTAQPSGVNDPHQAAQNPTATARNANLAGGATAAANTLAHRVDENLDDEAKEKARAKKDEYRARAKQYFSKKMPQERREQTVWRLKKMVLECQQHPDYQQAISTLLDLAELYGDHANRLAKGSTGTVQQTRTGLAQAEGDLKTLIERFANGTSTDDLWDSIGTIYDDADRDPELRNWFKAMNAYIRRCLQVQGYILDDESNAEWNRLYDHGNYLLRNKYRAHTDRIFDEVKFLADQFDQDPQNKSFADSMTKLFTDLGNDENGKPTFKPHLVKDLTEVILPAMFEKVAYIPVPRIEYSDHQVDAVIENLVLESDNFMPNVLEIASENYMRFGRKKFGSRSKHSIDVKVAGIQMDLRDVSYYIKRKQGFPSLSDTGVANILLAGEGFTFRMKMSTPDEKDSQNFFKIDKVDVDVKNLQIKLSKSNHKLLFGLFKPIMLKVLRPGLQKALEKVIKDQAHKLDGMLFQIKQEADRALDEAREDPENVPNIYNRYVTAAQKQVLQGKKKAEAVAADKKVNYAITKEDSMFPNIHLPGGISSKATEYKELARKGDKWESPVFSIGSASKSHDIPAAPKVVRKPHATTSLNSGSNGHANGSANGNALNGSTFNGGAYNGGALNGGAIGTYDNRALNTHADKKLFKMAGRTKREKSPDVDAMEEDEKQYGSGPLSYGEIDEHFPHRPKNHSRTWRFSELYKGLFDPLMECKPGSSTTATVPVSVGPAGRTRFGKIKKPPGQASYHEQRRHIIERFMSRWRTEVGNDFYPVMRLVLPDKDRDRGVYGLKESGIGKLLVKVMKIGKESEDGYSLLHWKLPGAATTAGGGRFPKGQKGSAGDFAGRVLEVVGKRPLRTSPGDMTIGEVNVLLDKLAAASGEGEQLPIFEEIYRGCCAEEIMWLVRIILKDMKVGATERTFLGLWHPDAEALFSVSSSLRRVCWELYDPEVRLEQKETGVAIMQCFQPQLAQFQMTGTFPKLVTNLGVTEENKEFWIEEKLDGERMQLHMMEDDSGLEDDKSALTRHLRKAFDEGVRNLIVDGEMITWDPEIDKIVPFGTLKTAALEQQNNPFQNGPRPLYRVFDILLLNDKSLTEYTLADRHKALERAVKGEHRRLEIHPYEAATSADAIEPLLRKVVAEASEGLVLKNPRSRYQLNSRNNDWIKVKPEYLSEFGESLDVVIVGGYYGSGRRGGALSSFMCGLRVSENHVRSGLALTREKCLSFCKVGGGFKAEDYAEIRHHTEGKWHDWDPLNPPTDYIELAGGKQQYERPDVWIRPSESVVISIKAAQFAPSDQFAAAQTLRFPRFRKLRLDKAWDAGMDVDDLVVVRDKIKQEEQERKTMEMENRKRQPAKRQKRDLVIAGTEPTSSAAGFNFSQDVKRPMGTLFFGLDFCVLSEAVKPKKMSKADLERLIKDNGGSIHQKVDKGSKMIILADKNVVRVASLKKAGDADIIRPKWVFDCLATHSGGEGGYLLPFEEGHILHATEEMAKEAEKQTDQFGDSYARDVDVEELRKILDAMGEEDRDEDFSAEQFLDQLEKRGHGELEQLRGFMFRRCRFGNGEVVDDLESGKKVTHVVVLGEDKSERKETAAEVRYQISSRRQVPRVVTAKWVKDCWESGTLVDEEDYVA
ncbi:hypothetical protein QBC35DRAFT_515923 [Podospora australis]|uniref:DNA ligase n=1 Tax=Podospora australis TaxID=1536484 RepID=A0AAN6WUS9_9PEZI|nr:hypothetical protein QBC35DRAFT_515923 [Podospora australis]